MPIKRGKQPQDGGKGGVVRMDGFLFLDSFRHEAYDEVELAIDHITAYRERLGTLPPYFAPDQKYGILDNRERLTTLGTRTSFNPRGHKAKEIQRKDPWFNVKQKKTEPDRKPYQERERALWTGSSAVCRCAAVGNVGLRGHPGDEPECSGKEGMKNRKKRKNIRI